MRRVAVTNRTCLSHARQHYGQQRKSQQGTVLLHDDHYTNVFTDILPGFPVQSFPLALANIGDERATARAVGRLKDRRAAEPLRNLLGDKGDKSDEVRFDATCALARLRDREAIPVLKPIERGERIPVHGQHFPDVAKRAIRFIETRIGKMNEYE